MNYEFRRVACLIIKKLFTPIMNNDVNKLHAGDIVHLSGTIYTARDAAHKKIKYMIDNKIELPINIKNEIIYYVGPCPAKEGQVIGSAGPTTSSRMDFYAPELLDLGLKGMIGKGIRSDSVKKSIIKNNAVYFGAIGGAGALISKCIVEAKIVAFAELGTEAIHEIKVVNFPLVVVIDNKGNDMYDIGKKAYQNMSIN
jgi:fumarate hydratase subunit beta